MDPSVTSALTFFCKTFLVKLHGKSCQDICLFLAELILFGDFDVCLPNKKHLQGDIKNTYSTEDMG